MEEKVAQGWTPDVIASRRERHIDCSGRTLYRLFKLDTFDDRFTLPMQGKRKPNGHQGTAGQTTLPVDLSNRETDHPDFSGEFGQLEGDTIVDVHHKSVVVILVERLSKAIITLKPKGRTDGDIETAINDSFHQVPKNLFKSITFDCGKEFSHWQAMSNQNDVDIYFADPGTPSQPGQNEHSNGVLWKGRLPKQMDFNVMDQKRVASVASRRNHLPRNFLNYQTPLEGFMNYMDVGKLSNLF